MPIYLDLEWCRLLSSAVRRVNIKKKAAKGVSFITYLFTLICCFSVGPALFTSVVSR